MARNAPLLKEVDLSYKDNALRVSYDDESTLEVWSKAFIDDHSMSFMLFGDEQFDKLTNDNILKQMKDFASKQQSKKYLKINDPDELEYNVYRYYSNDESIKQLVTDISSFLRCKPLSASIDVAKNKGNVNFVEYTSWNGSGYDVLLNVAILIAARSLKGNLTPKFIRFLSNIIIDYVGPEWRLGQHLEKLTGGVIKSRAFDTNLNLAKWSDGHIDFAKLAKASIENNSEKVVPPGLKKEMARFGLDIIIDETVTYETYRIWSDEELENFVEYNFNDVLGTKIIGENEVIVSELAARDATRKLYPYTSARAVNLANIHDNSPAVRDITSAQLAGLVLIGERKIRPIDWETVKYPFPLPKADNKDEFEDQDLLDYILNKEKTIHPFFEEFFGYFRGKDTRDFNDDKKIKLGQPITHMAKMNMPYYRNGKPIDAYIRFSTGGAHGSTCAGLHKMSPSDIETWIRQDIGTGTQKENRFTVDKTGVIHADFASFYPVMASKMRIYETEEGIDRYSPMITHRKEVKHKAEKLKENDLTHTAEYVELQSLQLAFKLILNATTGAGNMHRPNTSLPLDNKTFSMRLIGNMLIWVLGQRLVDAGAFVISTNTDGLFVTGITKDDAKVVIDNYIADYGMPVDPEYVTRFINATTSTRVEFDHHEDVPSRAGGTLGHAIDLKFSPFSLGRNVSIPLISGNAVLDYMANDIDWLNKPYDRSRIVKYITDKLKEGNKNEQAWYHVHSGTKSQKLTANGHRLQKVNRVVFTKDGDKFGGENLRALSKVNYIPVWNAYVNREVNDLKDIKFEDVDFYEWNEPILEINTNFDSLKLDFLKKEGTGRDEKYIPQNIDLKPIPVYDDTVYKTKSAFELDQKEFLNTIPHKILGYYDTNTDSWQPLKAWKPSSKVTNYPVLVGTTLNTAESLENFDYSTINVDAYVRMAEEQLKLWKKTADVPELNMKKIDDTVIKELVVKKKKTKKSIEIDRLISFYDWSIQNEF